MCIRDRSKSTVEPCVGVDSLVEVEDPWLHPEVAISNSARIVTMDLTIDRWRGAEGF